MFFCFFLNANYVSNRKILGREHPLRKAIFKSMRRGVVPKTYAHRLLTGHNFLSTGSFPALFFCGKCSWKGEVTLHVCIGLQCTQFFPCVLQCDCAWCVQSMLKGLKKKTRKGAKNVHKCQNTFAHSENLGQKICPYLTHTPTCTVLKFDGPTPHGLHKFNVTTTWKKH